MSRTILEDDIGRKLQAYEDRIRQLEEGLRGQLFQGLPPLRELPASPTSGQIVKLQLLPDTATVPGIYCFMQYRPESPSIYKWEYVGGGPSVRIFNQPYVNTALPGAFTRVAVNGTPTYSVPFTGEYQADWQIAMTVPSSAIYQPVMDRVGGGGLAEGLAGYGTLPSGENGVKASSRLALTAKDTCQMFMSCNGAAQSPMVYYCSMMLTPVRLSA